MNLKPNLWTLFFLIAGALLYFMVAEHGLPFKSGDAVPIIKSIPPADPVEAPKKDIIHIDQIEKDTFLAQYHSYKERYYNHVDTSKVLKGLVGVECMPMKGYTLEKTELDQMHSHYSTLDNPIVYVYPVIKRDTAINKDVFDLVFLIKDKTTEVEKFYDFTEPCPPVCGDEIPYTNYGQTCIIPTNKSVLSR